MALWRFRDRLDDDLATVGLADVYAGETETAAIEALDGVARKLGGDPAREFYGAADIAD